MIELKPAINEVKLTLKSISRSVNMGTVVEPSGNSGVPTEVRQAIYTLLENAAYVTTGLEDEIAIVQAWAQEVTALTLDKRSLELSNDTPEVITATVVPSGSTITWTSSDNSVATVVGGVVTGVANGSCVITATAGGLSANCAVTVSGFATLESISAVYTQSGIVSDTDSLDSLKDDLVVTAIYSDTTEVTLDSSTYTLSGTLEAGTDTITVIYRGKTTTFTVVVKHNTTAQIETSGKFLMHVSGQPATTGYTTYDSEYAGCTVVYDAGNPSTALYPAGIIPTGAWSEKVLYKDNDHISSLVVYDDNGNPINFVNETGTSSYTRWVQNKNQTMTEFSQSWNVSYYKIAFSVDTRYLDDAYMYDKLTGNIWFAGKNTPYYGMSNISEA